VNIYFFQFERLFIDWFAPLLCVFMAYATAYAYRFLVEEKEKRRVRRFFKSYVSPNLVEELLKDPTTMPSLKSERRMVSILFSDIAGFTSMSESLPPDEVEHILNEYLSAMTEIVFENDGTLDKYIGDAVMAVWGNVGPNNPQTDAYKAVNTALQMQSRLIELREKWLSEGMVPLQIRIGLNTGEVLVGNFGSPQKMDYTVIGDAVNTAARLEGLNKEFGTSIIISQSTYDLIQDRMNGRHCGTVKVKGKEEPVSVYEVLGWKSEGAAPTQVRNTKWVSGSNETQWK
jgi:adenylate cyclase